MSNRIISIREKPLLISFCRLSSSFEDTVYFEEAKLVLICKKLYQSELQESGFLYQETIDQNYPQRDFHTMYVGKIEKVLVRDDEYLK